MRSSLDSNSDMIRPCGLGHALVTATCSASTALSVINLSAHYRAQSANRAALWKTQSADTAAQGWTMTARLSSLCPHRAVCSMACVLKGDLTKVLSRQRSCASSGRRSWRKVERTSPRRPRVPFTRQSSASTRHASVTVSVDRPLW